MSKILIISGGIEFHTRKFSYADKYGEDENVLVYIQHSDLNVDKFLDGFSDVFDIYILDEFNGNRFRRPDDAEKLARFLVDKPVYLTHLFHVPYNPLFYNGLALKAYIPITLKGADLAVELKTEIKTHHMDATESRLVLPTGFSVADCFPYNTEFFKNMEMMTALPDFFELLENYHVTAIITTHSILCEFIKLVEPLIGMALDINQNLFNYCSENQSQLPTSAKPKRPFSLEIKNGDFKVNNEPVKMPKRFIKLVECFPYGFQKSTEFVPLFRQYSGVNLKGETKQNIYKKYKTFNKVTNDFAKRIFMETGIRKEDYLSDSLKNGFKIYGTVTIS